MQSLLASVRLTIVTMAICVAGYAALIWAIGQVFTPETAGASLLRSDDGTIIGSRQIAQNFTEPRYFWPRPSAVDYNAAAAGGSNKSPVSADLRKRAGEIVARYGATADTPLPPELAAASGAGLDPHISEHAARYQARRVAEARGIPVAAVEKHIAEGSFSPGWFLTPDRLVNVLELNLALDRMAATGQ
ncbi:MAG TPA: potassium-transporting ATPase subunit C [Bauldia sp.]|nr:potassium-transporting ATPase subunit C [Bauldia sp.]